MSTKESSLRKMLNEVFGETWERLENLGHAIGHENVLDNFVSYFSDSEVNDAINHIANEYDVKIDEEEEEEEEEISKVKPEDEFDKEMEPSDLPVDKKAFLKVGDLGSVGLNEIRLAIRDIMSESFWTEKDWEEHTGKSKIGNSEEKKALKGEVSYYINSYDYSLETSIDDVFKIAKKIYGDISEYDLIDTIKGVLVDIEKENDEIISTTRDRANEIYDKLEDTFEKVNEVVSAVSDTPTDDQIDTE